MSFTFGNQKICELWYSGFKIIEAYLGSTRVFTLCKDCPCDEDSSDSTSGSSSSSSNIPSASDSSSSLEVTDGIYIMRYWRVSYTYRMSSPDPLLVTDGTCKTEYVRGLNGYKNVNVLDNKPVEALNTMYTVKIGDNSYQKGIATILGGPFKDKEAALDWLFANGDCFYGSQLTSSAVKLQDPNRLTTEVLRNLCE